MRFHFRPSPLFSAVAVALTLAAAGADAQQAPGAPAPLGAELAPKTPPVAGARPQRPDARPDARPDGGAASAVVTGRIQRWLVNPNGEVDGLLLADGTQVGFPPHLSADVTAAFKVGDNLQVNGWRAPDVPVVRAASLSAPGSNRRVVDQPPAAGAQPRAPREPGALTAMNASGRVDRVLYTDRGDANGVLLDSGTIVRFPPNVGASYAATLTPGSKIEARGWGTRSANGNAIEATALGTSQGNMRELFAGPGSEPPPPGGPAPVAGRGRPGRAAPPATGQAMPAPPTAANPPVPAAAAGPAPTPMPGQIPPRPAS